MTIREAVEMLHDERRDRPKARFHCRAILVRTIKQYSQLLDELKKLGDIRVVSVDELFSGADVMPNYEVLTEKAYENEWLILPGVSEYLRLFHTNEETAQRFGSLWHFQSDADSVGRILIPLWGCETLWRDCALGLCGDVRQEEYVLDCCEGSESQKMKVQVLSGEFEQYMTELESGHGYASYGLKEWYSFWYAPNPDILDHLILTKRYKSIKPLNGDIEIQVVNDILGFIQVYLANGSLLTADICPKEAQECLFPLALKGETVDNAILAVLNAHVFRPLDVMCKWGTMTKGQKQLVFLWYALHPDDSYLGFCVGLSKSIDDLASHILTAIFSACKEHPEWIADSQELIAAVSIARDDDYFAQLEMISSLEDRLDFLTNGTARERVYILRLVGQWLRDDRDAVLQSRKLQETYPALAAYLSDSYSDESVRLYFRKYKTYKLSNTLPADEDSYFMGMEPEVYEYRYAAMCDEVTDGETFVLWIDALGIEWLPLLKWALETSCDGVLTRVKVAQAALPSETQFNDLWKQMGLPYEKYDKLDKLAHKGVVDDKDYYACVEEQFRFVAGIVGIVNKHLKQYARILITGDHGTSRLAARFFHKRDAMPLPANAQAGSHGRFCLIADGSHPIMAYQKLAKDPEGNRYLVFSNYDHYSQSGFAAGNDDYVPIYGEIHGGASPEEMLVPIFTVASRHEIPLTAKWNMPGNSVKIMQRRAKCRLQFSKPVTKVQAKIGEVYAECSSEMSPSKDWTASFSGLKVNKPTRFEVLLVADEALVHVDSIEIKPALGGDDPF